MSTTGRADVERAAAKRRGASDARQAHWRQVYQANPADRVSWFQPSPKPSLRMIEASGLAPPARVVDVGGGSSGLVDALIGRGFDVTVLDIADTALEVARNRLGEQAEAAAWIVADVTAWRPEQAYDLWHDRAVLHFLTDPPDRARYVETLKAALKPGGAAVLAAFAEDGPERCSGLPVQRYDAVGLAALLGPEFRLLRRDREAHATPWGAEQAFTWTLFRREG